MPKLNKLSLIVALLMPVLTACQSNSKLQAAVCPVLPKKPSLSTPLPTVTYLKSASLNIEQWQKKLMDTQLMQKD